MKKSFLSLAIIIVFTFTCFAQLTTINSSYVESYQDYIVPSNIESISFEAKGGDAGFAGVLTYFPNPFGDNIPASACFGEGGKGAVASASYNVGNGPGQIPPGSTIRTIVGGKGENRFDNNDITGSTIEYSGGGGGTGVLVRYPGAIENNWNILVVAGGGGGAYVGVVAWLCSDEKNGFGGSAGTSGTAGDGGFPGAGGSNGYGGYSEATFSGGGGGWRGQGEGYYGCTIFPDGTAYSATKLNVAGGGAGWNNHDYIPLNYRENWCVEYGLQCPYQSIPYYQGGVGGNEYDCNAAGALMANGGYGFGGGGAGAGAGGGGGGYSGGGGGGLTGTGGGGGSFVSGNAILQRIIPGGITNVQAGQMPEHGYVNMTYYVPQPPVAACYLDGLRVILNDAGIATISAADGGYGYDPEGFPVTLALSQDTFDCSNIGNNPVTLTVTDIDGMSSDCTFNVTVIDDEIPEFTSPLSPNGEGTWQDVGNSEFLSENSDLQSLAMDGSTPYVAFQDNDNGGGVSVMTFDGSDWLYVGNPGFSAGSALFISLAMDGSTPYVAYQDLGNGFKTTVMKFDGTNWVNVGNPGFSQAQAYYQSLALDGNTPYVAFRDGANGLKTTVMKFDGTNWVNVGNPGFSQGRAEYQSLALDGNTPYVAYKDFANGLKTTVMKFDGANWINVGNPGFSQGRADYQSLALDGNTPYVAFRDRDGLAGASVMKFDGSDWVHLEDPIVFFFQQPFIEHSLALDGSTPYLAVRTNFLNGNEKIKVVKFDGTRWVEVGSVISSGNTTNPSLALDGNTPFVAFRKNEHTGVMKFEPPSVLNLTTDASLCTSSASIEPPTVTDNCANDITINGPFPAGPYPIGNTTVFWITSDSSNLAYYYQIISVTDSEPTTLSCPENITQGNDLGTCGAEVTYVVPSTTSNCTNESMQQTAGLPSGSQFPIGTTTNTFVINNGDEITETCSFDVIINDTEPPSISCPANIVVSNDPGQCGAVVSFSAPTAIDNCGAVVVVQLSGIAPGTIFPIGETMVTYEAMDDSGNRAQCSFKVTVNDKELPTFANCVANSRGPILLPPYASITQQMVIDAAGMPSDNCGIPNISGVGRTSYANDGCLTTELWTVSGEDAFGNTGSCQVTFQYTEDIVAPIITCPDDITVSNDPGFCGSYVNIPPPVITDNCSDTYYEMSPPPGYLFPIGTTTVTVTAYDLPGIPATPGTSKTSAMRSVGNQTQCTFTVTVNDTEAPVADCKNITVDLGVGGTYSLQASDIVGPNAKDNCGFSLSIPNTSFDCDDVGNTIDVLLTLTDPSGNLNSCTAQVTVTDSNSYCCQAPIITCPADVTVECDLSTEPGATGIATSTEGCGVVDISISDTFIPGCGITGRILRTWTATDEKGDTDVCIQTITIIDIMPPVIVCPVDIDVNNDPGLCSAVVNYTIDFSDNCSGKKQMNFEQTAGLPSGEAFPVGITTNTFVITDECGNSNTCSFKVTVTDNEAPVVECRPDVTVNNDAGQCSALLDSDQLKLLQSSDNCLYTTDERWAHISYSVAGASNFTGTGYDAGLNGTSFNVGISVLTYTMVDDAGHTSSDSMIITVVDNEAPVITCPADITTVKTSDGGTGDCYATLSLVSPTVSDNCTLIADITVTNDAPATFPIGDTTVKWTVKDATGNEQTCTQKVTVTDDEKPSITCPADITTSSDTGLCTASLDGFTATATDNCDTNPVITSTIGDIPVVWPYDFPFGDTEVVWRATDVAGNFSECTQTVTVDDIVTGTSFTVSPSTQQYSDKVTFDVSVTPGDCSGAGQAATYALIYLGTQLMGKAPLSVDGFGNLTGSLDAVLLENSSNGQMSPGVKTVKAVFMGINPNYTVNDATTDLTITQENANVEYTGQSLQATPSASASGATVVLSANIQDVADGYRGDIRNAKVMFVNRDSGSSPISGWIPVVDLVDPSDATLGAVSFSWGVDIGSSNAESYTVGIVVDNGYYKRNSSEDDTVITVYKPVGDFITGGGYIRPDASAGQYASTDGLKTNFGFNVGYNKKGNKLKGHMNVIFRRLESDGTVHVYQIKANAIQSLGVNISDPEAKFATFITKTNLTDITNPLNTISLGGNLILKVDMTDRGEPGTDDSIAINLTDGGTLVYSSNWTGISTSEMVLSAGNLLVHSGYSVGRTDATASTALDTGSGTFELQAWPNPSKDEFNIKLNSANKVDKVEIFVYDINGRQVYYNAGKAGEEYHFGSNLESGMYFVNITQANESRQVKLIKY